MHYRGPRFSTIRRRAREEPKETFISATTENAESAQAKEDHKRHGTKRAEEQKEDGAATDSGSHAAAGGEGSQITPSEGAQDNKALTSEGSTTDSSYTKEPKPLIRLRQ